MNQETYDCLLETWEYYSDEYNKALEENDFERALDLEEKMELVEVLFGAEEDLAELVNKLDHNIDLDGDLHEVEK